MVRNGAAGRISRTVAGMAEEVGGARREVRKSHGHLAAVVGNLNGRRIGDMEVQHDAWAGQPGLIFGDDAEYLLIIASGLRSLHREAGDVRAVTREQRVASGLAPTR